MMTVGPIVGREYTAPHLTVFGAVAELTASGQGTSCETPRTKNGNGGCSNNAINPSSQDSRKP